MITIFLSPKNIADIYSRLEDADISFQRLRVVSPNSADPAVIKLETSESSELARIILSWLTNGDVPRKTTIRRDTEVFNAADLSVGALDNLLKTASDVHMFTLRASKRRRIDENQSRADRCDTFDSPLRVG
jgi:hypothetical protein